MLHEPLATLHAHIATDKMGMASIPFCQVTVVLRHTVQLLKGTQQVCDTHGDFTQFVLTLRALLLIAGSLFFKG